MPSALVPLLETNAGTGSVPVPLKSASASVMFSIVTLPVLVTVNVYSMVFPSADSTRSEEHTSEFQSLMRISYAVFCLKKKYHSFHKSTHLYTMILSHHT